MTRTRPVAGGSRRQPGFVIDAKPPEAEAEPGDPLAFEWTVKTPSIAEAVIA